MKVKKGLKEFIEKNMEFFIELDGFKCLDIRPERLMFLSKKDISFAGRLNEAYQSKIFSRMKTYPTLKPGMAVDLVCGERYLIVSTSVDLDVDLVFNNRDCYRMLGLNETLNTCMFGPDLRIKPSYAKLSSKIRDISKVYRVDNYNPGVTILLGTEPSEYSLIEIWKR